MRSIRNIVQRHDRDDHLCFEEEGRERNFTFPLASLMFLKVPAATNIGGFNSSHLRCSLEVD